VKLTINNIDQLLDEKLTLFDRGVLITLMLLKEKDPKLLQAKFKVKVKYNKEVRASLLKLHNEGFVQWDRANKAAETLKKDLITPAIVEVIEFMNEVWGTNIKTDSKLAAEAIGARLKDCSVDDCKLVISNRWALWQDDKVMSKYLRYSTVFRASKFPLYLEEAQRTKIGKSRVEASKLELKKGDILTNKHLSGIVDNDLYSLRRYSLNSNGERSGLPTHEKKYGRDVKTIIKITESIRNRGAISEYEWIYWPTE